MEVLVNGRWHDESKTPMLALDRGFLFGDGLFETIAIVDGRPVMLDDHVRRMLEGARLLRFAAHPDEQRLREIVSSSIERKRVVHGSLRITLTRGMGGIHTPLSDLTQYTVTVELRPLPEDRRLFQTDSFPNASAVIVSTRRNPSSILPRVKSLNYLDNILAKDEARRKQGDEALFRDPQGYLAEGAGSNLFVVQDGKVLTPTADGSLLPGTVRQAVLALCPKLGLECRETKLSPGELLQAEEAFLTNAVWGIRPLCRVDGSLIGKGTPGPISLRLLQAFREAVEAGW